MGLSEAKRQDLVEVLSDWDRIPTDIHIDALDWRTRALRGVKENDVGQMKADAAPLAQYKVIELMQRSESEALQLDAAKFILAQNGQGPIQKVDHNVMYEKMDADQLVAILKSKLSELAKLNPNIKIELPSNIIDAEITEVEGEEIGSCDIKE